MCLMCIYETKKNGMNFLNNILKTFVSIIIFLKLVNFGDKNK